jgi:hypothetical protein
MFCAMTTLTERTSYVATVSGGETNWTEHRWRRTVCALLLTTAAETESGGVRDSSVCAGRSFVS